MKRALILMVLVLFLIGFVFGVPAAPSPTCKIKGEISKVEFQEIHNLTRDLCKDREIPTRYLLDIKINEVSTVLQEGDQTCEELYTINSKKTIVIYESKVNEGDSFKENQIIEANINFAGDECYGGIFLTGYGYEIKEDENGDDEDEFCGTSTQGICETDSDCVTDGCSGQVCRAISEEPIITTCEALECYNDEKYNMECSCINDQCKWNKESKGKGELNREEIKNIIRERNRLKFENRTGVECAENCTCTGSTMKCEIDGNRVMTIYAGKSGNVIVQIKGENMSTNVTLYKADGKLYGQFKNKTKEVRILPDEIKEKIKEKIKAKIEKHSAELNEEGFYIVQAQKRARLFYIFPVREKVNLQLDAENGEFIKLRNPWWGFLARDVEQ